jgi:hypothetical protein
LVPTLECTKIASPIHPISDCILDVTHCRMSSLLPGHLELLECYMLF